MTIEIVDVTSLAHERKKRKIIMDTNKMHSWMHYYPNPGDHDDMHCHPGDQTFLLLEGECTMSFPDGKTSVLQPGMVALIEGGSFYKLQNSGAGPMILMGTRTGPHSANQHVNFETKTDMTGIRGTRGTDGERSYGTHMAKEGEALPTGED